jgi:hypothetical protein
LIVEFVGSGELPILTRIQYLELIEAVVQDEHELLTPFVDTLLPILVLNFVYWAEDPDSGPGIVAFSRQVFVQMISVFRSDELNQFCLALIARHFESEDWRLRFAGIYALGHSIHLICENWMEIEMLVASSVSDSVPRCREMGFRLLHSIADNFEEAPALFEMVLEGLQNEGDKSARKEVWRTLSSLCTESRIVDRYSMDILKLCAAACWSTDVDMLAVIISVLGSLAGSVPENFAKVFDDVQPFVLRLLQSPDPLLLYSAIAALPAICISIGSPELATLEIPWDLFTEKQKLDICEAFRQLSIQFGPEIVAGTEILPELLRHCSQDLEVRQGSPDSEDVFDNEPVYRILVSKDLVLGLPQAQIFDICDSIEILSKFIAKFPALFVDLIKPILEVAEKWLGWGLEWLQLSSVKLIQVLICNSQQLGIALETFLEWPDTDHPEVASNIAFCLELVLQISPDNAAMFEPIVRVTERLLGESRERLAQLPLDRSGTARRWNQEIAVEKNLAKVVCRLIRLLDGFHETALMMFPFGEEVANKAAAMKVWTQLALCHLLDADEVAAFCSQYVGEELAIYRKAAIKSLRKLGWNSDGLQSKENYFEAIRSGGAGERDWFVN